MAAAETIVEENVAMAMAYAKIVCGGAEN